jgi:hypothetical protein
MSIHAATLSRAPDAAEPAPADETAPWTRAVLERQLAMLGRLAEIGLEIAAALERQVQSQAQDQTQGEADAAPVTRGDIVLAYGRAARAVRMTIALQSQLMKDFLAYGQDAWRAADHADRITRHASGDVTRKLAVKRIMGRVICAATDSQEVAERLARRINLRLDDETLCDDLSQPYSEIIAAICSDLGLEPDWDGLSQEAWARAEIACGRPGAPLAAIAPRAAKPPPRPHDGMIFRGPDPVKDEASPRRRAAARGP